MDKIFKKEKVPGRLVLEEDFLKESEVEYRPAAVIERNEVIGIAFLLLMDAGLCEALDCLRQKAESRQTSVQIVPPSFQNKRKEYNVYY